jgi:hypothetical protein
MSLDAGAVDVRDVTERFDRAVRMARFARSAADYDPVWDLLHEAAHVPDVAADLALTHLTSADTRLRATACDLLGVVAHVDRSRRAPAAAVLVTLRESHPDVVRAIVRAAGETRDPGTRPLLTAHATSADVGVRLAVAHALTLVMTDDDTRGEDGRDALDALIALTRDPDPEVRNWATFGLGWQLPVDGPEVRAALWARTADEYADAREEGVRGLARRRDGRAIPLVAALLATRDAHVHTFDAAAFLGAPELVGPLSAYDRSDPGVALALQACDPVAREARDDRAWALFRAVAERYPELPVALYCERFELGTYLDVAPLELADATQMAGLPVDVLLRRAYGDVALAAELFAAQAVAPVEDR